MKKNISEIYFKSLSSASLLRTISFLEKHYIDVSKYSSNFYYRQSVNNFLNNTITRLSIIINDYQRNITSTKKEISPPLANRMVSDELRMMFEGSCVELNSSAKSCFGITRCTWSRFVLDNANNTNQKIDCKSLLKECPVRKILQCNECDEGKGKEREKMLNKLFNATDSSCFNVYINTYSLSYYQKAQLLQQFFVNLKRTFRNFIDNSI